METTQKDEMPKPTRPVKAIKPVSRGRFKNPTAMVKSLSEDATLADRSVEQMCERRVVDHLMAKRSLLGLSQKDIAKKMGCTQSRISKLERGKDTDLRIGDFQAYADALALGLRFVLTKKDTTIVDQVKQHVFAIRKLLLRLVELADKDQTIAHGTQSFFAEVVLNSVNVVLEASDRLEGNLDSASKNGILTNIPRESPPTIQVEDVTNTSCATQAACPALKLRQHAPA